MNWKLRGFRRNQAARALYKFLSMEVDMASLFIVVSI